MTGRDLRCCSRITAREGIGQGSGGNDQDFGASADPVVQALWQDAQRPVTERDDIERSHTANGLLEEAFAPANRRRVLRHLLALHSASRALQIHEQDEKAPFTKTFVDRAMTASSSHEDAQLAQHPVQRTAPVLVSGTGESRAPTRADGSPAVRADQRSKGAARVPDLAAARLRHEPLTA